MRKINGSDNISLKNVHYIKFYPCVKSAIGCEKAALLLERMEYWFKRYSAGFYKFVEPCLHPLYREGDSWSEEIGFSRKIFVKAFDVIGVRYKSKTDFLRANDKFQGKFYASYHDRRTNQTYYVRNHTFVADLLKKIFIKKKSSAPDANDKKKEEPNKTKNAHKSLKQEVSQSFKKEVISQTHSKSSSLVGLRSRNGDLGRSPASVPFLIQKKTSSLSKEQTLPDSIKPIDTTLTEEMIKIWNKEVGELGVGTITKSFLTRLNNTFKTSFDQSIDSWKNYCQAISSSRFLMGEAQNKFFKKAWITWAIRPETIERIQGGGFRLGDRQTLKEKEIENIDNEIKNTNQKKEIISVNIKNIQNTEKQKRKAILKEKIKTLSNKEIKKFKKEFIEFIEEENSTMTEEFRKFKWDGMFIAAYFEEFMKEKIEAKLFKRSLKEDQQDALYSSGLLEEHEKVCQYVSALQQRQKDLLSQNLWVDKDEGTKVSSSIIHWQDFSAGKTRLYSVLR